MKIPLKIIFLFIFLFLLRIIYIDSDLPSHYITNIIQTDEGYYTIPAFNLYHYGEMSHQILDYIPDDGSPANVFQNILTWISLEIFGNTYYGLRFASVFISMIVLILFYLLAKQLLKQQEFKYKNHLILGTTIYWGFDFEFLLLSRVAEPTIFRTFSMIFLIYLFYLRDKNNKIDSKLWTFFIGLFATFSVFFVYFYNLFILAGSWLAIVLYFFINKEKKKAVIHTIIYGFGFILGVLLFELFLRVAYNQNLIEYFQFMQTYSSRLSYSNGFIGFIKNIFINLFNMFGTNIFRFNISFLFIFLLFIPIFIYKLKKEKKYFDFIIFSLIFMHILQILFENSYFYRRLTILLPLILLLLLLSADYLTIFIEKFKNNKYFKGYLGFIILFSLIIFYVSNISSYGMGALLSTTPVRNTNIFVFFIILTFFLYLTVTIKNIINNKSILNYYSVFFLILPNFYSSITEIYYNPSYYFKNIMMSIKPEVENKITTGYVNFSYRLYNNSIPILNYYNYELFPKKYQETINKLFNDNCEYYIDFENRWNYQIKLDDLIYKEEKFIILPIISFYTGNSFVLSLYKKILKDDKNLSDLIKKFNCKKAIKRIFMNGEINRLNRTFTNEDIINFNKNFTDIFNDDKDVNDEINKCVKNYDDIKINCILDSNKCK